MSNNKMLIDAGHPEETRVVMVRGNRVDEFDFESEHKTQLRGNIYLAKVTRVEPSLQAAFVDYGGNRHGFLAFSEIHPDYYQIPVADRQALLDAEAEDAREAAEAEALQEQEEEAKDKPARKRRSRRRGKSDAKKADAEENSEDTETEVPPKDEAPEEEEAVETEENPESAEVETTTQESEDQAAGSEDAEAPASEEDVAVADDASSDDEGVENDTDEESDDDSKTIAAENDGDDVVSEPAKPKRKTTRRPRKKKAEDEVEAATEDSAAEAEAETAPADESTEEAIAEEPPKRKRRRTSRVKADAEADDKSEESPAPVEDSQKEPVAEEPAAEIAAEAEKPKRRRTSRKKKTEEAVEAAEEKATEPTEAEAAEASESTEEGESEAKPKKTRSRSRSRRRKSSEEAESVEAGAESENGDSEGDDVEEMGSEDALEEVPTRRAPRRHYKIQEVIKRRQILLVQVVKEERGNKGAALTTYLSLAGRYSVLMPNTARGGGISRKITNASDRKRLKAIAANLEVPQGMGVILRTAGASRQPEDIQRDFEYLMRLWENVRSLTLESTAPYLVYEEGSLIKRSIRDMYDKDTGEILVAGEQGYREAKDFMTMLMPSHAKNVKLYRDRIPMFARMGVEAQLDAMLQPEVTLKSGGYIIIDQTEALVAIDVNSGRSTRQHSVEETAVQTNLEAADEVARQLRLRDLAGLIVIDFIDMEDKRNIRSVEKRLKEALKEDRARIQVGRISHFGLMEMSRQRIRASVLESTTQTCPVCEGLGHVRAPSSVAISVLRSIEEQLHRNSRNNLIVKVSTETALYMLNNKRDNLGDLENRFSVSISIATDDSLGNTSCAIERGEVSNRKPTQDTAVQPDSIELGPDEADIVEPQDLQPIEGDVNGTGKKRRRRRRRRKSNANAEANEEAVTSSAEGEESNSGDSAPDVSNTTAEAELPSAEGEEKPTGRIKRTRRSRSKKTDEAETAPEEAKEATAEADAGSSTTEDGDEKPAKKARRTRRKKAEKSDDDAEKSSASADAAESAAENAGSEDQPEDPPAKPKRRTTRRKKSDDDGTAGDESAPVQMAESSVDAPQVSEVADTSAADASPKKSGWWQRKFF